MTVVRLKGVKQVTRRLASGECRTYWYAWNGGPRLDGSPGSPEFAASYVLATKARKTPPAGTLGGLVVLYRASPEWARNADSTKYQWGRWLDEIAETDKPLSIGGYSIEALNDPDVTGDLLAWRDQWAETPRTADYAMQVLSRVLSWSTARRKLRINAAEGIEDLYVSNRADQIWTDDEMALVSMCADSPEAGFIIWLACLSGLRREDLATLAWSHVGDVAIVMPTAKSGGARTATVPILAETAELLDEISAHQVQRWGGRCTTVLANTFGDAWTPSGLSHAVLDARRPCGIVKRLHDARGTFGTRLRHAGLRRGEIADTLGWEEDRVERLLKTYVDRDAIVMRIAERIARSER